VSNVFPGLELEIGYDQRVDEHVVVSVKYGEARLPLDAVGTGTLQAIQVLANLYLFKPRVLLLDEPDSHLHPDNQRRMIRALWQVSEMGYTQVIATTHSRHVLNAKPELAKLLMVSGGRLVPGAEERPVALLMELGAIDDTERLTPSYSPTAF
jgi:ABC-type ATPase involved in cell division